MPVFFVPVCLVFLPQRMLGIQLNKGAGLAEKKGDEENVLFSHCCVATEKIRLGEKKSTV